MPLTILTNAEIRQILYDLSREDLEIMQQNMAEAMHSYSTGDTNSPCCSDYQPLRTAVKKNGVTTLFMPATTGNAVGMKIVSLEQPEAPSLSASKKSSVSSATSSINALQLTSTPPTSDSASSASGSTSTLPSTIASYHSSIPRGTVTLLDSAGYPVGILNAEELTAFRTALSSTILFGRRTNVHTLTVFGAGRTAYWHIRLALLLRAPDIHRINIINRTFERSMGLMNSFHVGQGGKPEWAHVKFSALSPEFVEFGRLLKDEVRKADTIFCCTASTEPLFPHEFLTSHEGRKKGRYICAIGSYAPHMIELHPEILRTAAKPTAGGRHLHKHAQSDGVVIVDSLESCMKEAGEIIQAQLSPEQIVEVGELIMVKKAAMEEIELGTGKGEQGMLEWLRKGNVVFKSVGLGLMDLVTGADCVRIAKAKGVGTTIEDF